MLIAVASLVLLPYPLLLHHVKYILVCIIIFITVKTYRTNRLCFQQLFHMGYVFKVISEYHIDIQLLYCVHYFEFSLINKFTITFCLCNPQLLNLPHLIILYPLISSLYSNLLPINLLLLCFYKFLYKLLFRNHVCSVIS